MVIYARGARRTLYYNIAYYNIRQGLNDTYHKRNVYYYYYYDYESNDRHHV